MRIWSLPLNHRCFDQFAAFYHFITQRSEPLELLVDLAAGGEIAFVELDLYLGQDQVRSGDG
jgi:hypothetical protein